MWELPLFLKEWPFAGNAAPFDISIGDEITQAFFRGKHMLQPISQELQWLIIASGKPRW